MAYKKYKVTSTKSVVIRYFDDLMFELSQCFFQLYEVNQNYVSCVLILPLS